MCGIELRICTVVLELCICGRVLCIYIIVYSYVHVV